MIVVTVSSLFLLIICRTSLSDINLEFEESAVVDIEPAITFSFRTFLLGIASSPSRTRLTPLVVVRTDETFAFAERLTPEVAAEGVADSVCLTRLRVVGL